MAGDDDNLKEFPDVTSKLSAPKKLSAFEKERQQAEEKKRRAEAETAAALKEFEDTFGQDDSDKNENEAQDYDDIYDGFPPGRYQSRGSRSGGPPGHGSYGRHGRPHGGSDTLRPPLGMQPPSLKRKRALDEMREAQEARFEHDIFSSAGRAPPREYTGSPAHAREDDGEEEDIAPKPTVQLTSLPPATTVEDVRSLLRGHLPVHSVHIQPQASHGASSRKSSMAIATLTAETPIPQIDTAVSALKDKYLGGGFYLSISRHLSSSSLLPSLATASFTTSGEPFGAQKPDRDQPRGPNMRNAPPPSHFAPPESSYDMPSRSMLQNNAFVEVQPPLQINTVRAIHTVVDRLLSEPDPERALQIEAMLMALPEVYNDERFSFLYDSRSTGGIYYRYLLWNDEDSYEAVQQKKRLARGPERVIDDAVIDWIPPYEEVPFADLSRLADVIDHMNYESSDEESDDGEVERQFNNGRREGEGPPVASEKKHLTPLQVAKFAWLLSQMPTNHAKLRKGDIAAVTSFAINHAGAGADEIVDMLVLNIEKPYTNSQCAKFGDEDYSQHEDDDYEPRGHFLMSESSMMSDGMSRSDKKEPDDPSQAKLVALYLINDILHNSSTAGVRNAWKYRQLFESSFKQQSTFEHLGRLEKDLGWGRMKAEQWRNRIRVLFEIWEHGSVFASDAFETFKKSFYEQPADATETFVTSETGANEEKWMSRFKKIDATASLAESASPAAAPMPPEPAQTDSADVDGQSMNDLDGDPMEDLDGEPMDDLDGEPMEDIDGTLMDGLDGNATTEAIGISQKEVATDNATAAEPVAQPATEKIESNTLPGLKLRDAIKDRATATQPSSRRRKQAEDMFADSDEE